MPSISKLIHSAKAKGKILAQEDEQHKIETQKIANKRIEALADRLLSSMEKLIADGVRDKLKEVCLCEFNSGDIKDGIYWWEEAIKLVKDRIISTGHNARIVKKDITHFDIWVGDGRVVNDGTNYQLWMEL